jgi:hypothetical protein
MKFLLQVFVLALVAFLAAAESELAHAMELVYMFSKYETERTVYTGSFWLANGCQGSGLRGGCSFNQVSYSPALPTVLYQVVSTMFHSTLTTPRHTHTVRVMGQTRNYHWCSGNHRAEWEIRLDESS